VERRVAQGRPPDRPADRGFEPDDRWARRRVGIGGAIAFGVLALFAYAVGDDGTQRIYNHFVWQALAFLDGRTAIDYPVAATDGLPGNEVFQDVMPVQGPNGEATGRGLIPFPPLPALLLTPFVALWGLATDDQAIAGVLGALDVVLAWWMLGRLPIGTGARVVGTAFFGFGTVFFYTAELGTTWYFAHVVAVGLALVAVGLALQADPDAAFDEDELPDPVEPDVDVDADRGRGWARGTRDLLGLIDRRQVAVGFLFGLACTARLTMAFAAPFFLLVGAGRGWFGRGLSAGLGASVPIAGLLLYNVVSTGHVFHPAYEYLYQAEAHGYPTLGYNPEWSIEDPRYIPQNLGIALFSTPAILPDVYPAGLGGGEPLCTEPGAERGLFDRDCPIALPRDTGMSILLTSPAYLLAVPTLLALYGRSRLVSGALLAVVLVFVVNLMHFSQGWVQFGYRFSNDFVPFALPLVALGAERLRRRPVVVAGLLVTSIAVNLWGAAWGALLGW
jgi:hypothetical protein